jgi:hypothetical protein
VTPPNRSRHAVALALAALAAATSTTACRNAAPAFGNTPGEARTAADGMFTVLEQRFSGVQRSPKFAQSRAKIFSMALVPSRLYTDTSVWNSNPGPEHSLTVVGHFSDGRYRFTDVPLAQAPVPSQLGDSRHVVALTKLNAADFTWSTDVVTDWGTITGGGLANVFSAILATAAHAHNEASLRANYREAFPHATEALGRLMSLDTIRVTPSGDGSARVTLVTTIHPERLKETAPAYAAYLTKYADPARFSITLLTPDSVRWLDIAAEQDHIVISLRTTADGHLAPFVGPPRPMPSTLIMRSSWFEKMSLFTVGMSDLDADFTITSAPHERAWVFGLHRPPEWHLPLSAARIMHATITRPFEGAGTVFRLSIRDSAGGPSIFQRQVTSTVKESPIMRWLGGLGGSAANEFEGQADIEENRFDAELFAALRTDIDALLPTTDAARGQ